MFKRIVIEMLNPICDCDNSAHTSWSIIREINGKHGIQITCDSCKTSLNVPHAKFRAGFKFTNPRPEPKVQPKSTVDNVIDLFRSKK